ncbi:ParB-like dsDNA partitioning protein [Gordonia phage Anon]|nr:ParB-like dsDNA partitioning protein [Gordonia phage Anon]
MVELRGLMAPKVDHTEKKKASETFGNGRPNQHKLKQYSVYLPPEYMLWLKRKALEMTAVEKEPVNASRLLTQIVEAEIKRDEAREAKRHSGEDV